MSDNSEKGAKKPEPATPAKVVRPASRGDAAASTGSTVTPPGMKAPAPSTSEKASGAAPAAAAKKAAPAKKATPAKPAAAAPVKKAAPSAAPASAQASAPATKATPVAKPAEKVAAKPAEKVAAKPAPKAADKTAVTPAVKAPVTGAPAEKSGEKAAETPGEKPAKRGFGDRLRSGVAKTASLAQVRGAEGASEAPVVVDGVEEDRPVRRARLLLTRIDPWSVAKVAFLLSAAFGLVLFVAVLITWSVLGAAGIWDAVNSVVGSVAASSDGTSTFDVRDYVGMGRVLGLTLVISVVNVVLLTAIATLVAYLYNMAAALLGGVEVTFSEEQD